WRVVLRTLRRRTWPAGGPDDDSCRGLVPGSCTGRHPFRDVPSPAQNERPWARSVPGEQFPSPRKRDRASGFFLAIAARLGTMKWDRGLLIATFRMCGLPRRGRNDRPDRLRVAPSPSGPTRHQVEGRSYGSWASPRGTHPVGAMEEPDEILVVA